MVLNTWCWDETDPGPYLPEHLGERLIGERWKHWLSREPTDSYSFFFPRRCRCLQGTSRVNHFARESGSKFQAFATV